MKFIESFDYQHGALDRRVFNHLNVLKEIRTIPTWKIKMEINRVLLNELDEDTLKELLYQRI